MGDLKQNTRLAVVSSFLLVFTLLLVGHPEGAGDLFVMCGMVLVLTYLTITTWVECAKKYIDRAIDRRLATNEREVQQS